MTKQLAKLLYLKTRFKNGVYNKSSVRYVSKSVGLSRTSLTLFLEKCVNLNWARIEGNKLIFNKLECVWDGMNIKNISLNVSGSIKDITERLEALPIENHIRKQQYMQRKAAKKSQCINTEEGYVQLSLKRIKFLFGLSKSKASRLMCSLQNKDKLKIKRQVKNVLPGRRITKENFLEDAKGLFRGCFWSNGQVVKVQCNKYAF